MPTDTLERAVLERSASERALFRAEHDDDGEHIGVLHGHAAVFNTWTEIDNWYEGHFMERIAPTAFNKTISENMAAIRCLFKHGWDPQVGDKVLGAFDQLRADDVGLYYEVLLDDTSYNRDLKPGLAKGQYGASFRAEIVNFTRNEKPGKSPHNPEGIPEVTYTELKLKELGPCTFGAYPSATSALRADLDDLWERMKRDPDLLERFLDRAHDLRTPGTTDETSAGEGAASTDNEPARSHSDVTPNADQDRLWLDRLRLSI